MVMIAEEYPSFHFLGDDYDHPYVSLVDVLRYQPLLSVSHKITLGISPHSQCLFEYDVSTFSKFAF